MGLDLHLKHVTFNAAHERRVITGLERNPADWRSGNLVIRSIFRRVASHDDVDGNPLIYALKGLKGYTTDWATIKALARNGRLILGKALAGSGFDLVVPVPSSSSIAWMVARRCARRANCSVAVVLRKATFAEVLAVMPPIDQIPHRDRADYGLLLKTLSVAPQGTHVVMKKVTKRLRKYLKPVKSVAEVSICQGKSVLLVDDLYGSGTSLRAAADELIAAGATYVEALTLLGRL